MGLYIHLIETHWSDYWTVAGGHTPCPGTISTPQVHHFWVLGPRSIVLCVCTFPCPRSSLVLMFCGGSVVGMVVMVVMVVMVWMVVGDSRSEVSRYIYMSLPLSNLEVNSMIRNQVTNPDHHKITSEDPPPPKKEDTKDKR